MVNKHLPFIGEELNSLIIRRREIKATHHIGISGRKVGHVLAMPPRSLSTQREWLEDQEREILPQKTKTPRRNGRAEKHTSSKGQV